MTTPGNDIQFSTDTVGSHESPLWRYFVAELDGTGLTDYSKLASNRVVSPILDAPLSMTGEVPSDNVQVWLTSANDNDPFLAPGTRLLYGFRRESATPPYYVVRAATLCQLVEDSAAQDDARTKFTGYDPWKYLMSRPICDPDGNILGSAGYSQPGATYDVAKGGVTFPATQASVVIATLLGNTTQPPPNGQGHTYIDAGVTYTGTGFWTGVLETGAGMVDDWFFLQGTSVGQAWQEVVSKGLCNIWLEPIYDPFNRPTYLCQLSVFAQMGSTKDEQVFAWNMPGRSLVGITRTIDGSVLANNAQYYFGQGGPPAALQTDAASEDKYGEYWAQQFYPGQDEAGALALAVRAVQLRKVGKQTVSFKPAPERSPRPWQDYNLGDRVPVWADKTAFRQNISGPNPPIDSASNGSSWFVLANGDYRTFFPDGAQFTALGAGANTGSWIVASTAFVGGDTRVVTTVAPANAGAGGNLAVTQYQRIYGWVTNISDEALETIDPVLTSPQGFS